MDSGSLIPAFPTSARPLTIIDAPSDLGLKPTGVRELPSALRAAGLLHGVPHLLDDTPIAVPAYESRRDPSTGVLNPHGIRDVSVQLADRVHAALEADRFPLVLGGDCSILLGNMLALRRHGRFGLLFLDGHADFYSPESEPSGEVASMELAIVTGRGPRLLADLEGRRPLVREEDVALLAFRDADTAREYGSPNVRDTRINVLDLAETRGLGPADAACRAIEQFEANGAEGFWIHLDADVLHDEEMPAVDYRMPDGLRAQELEAMLAATVASPLVTGMDVTIYNPALDDVDQGAARTLARTLNRVLTTLT